MTKVMQKEQGFIACTEEELEALREAVRDADGRKSEVKLAREVLGT